MDIYTMYFTVVALVFIVTSRLATGNKGLNLQVPYLAGYLTKHDKCDAFGPLRLLTMSLLVSVFSCAEFATIIDKDVQRVEMKMRLLDVYKSLVFSVFVLVGTKLQSPIFLGLWLSFTLKNLLREVSFIAFYFFEPISQNFAVFAIFWTFVTYLWLVQLQWWGVLANVYSSLWNDVFDQVARLNGPEKPDMDVCLREREELYIR